MLYVLSTIVRKGKFDFRSGYGKEIESFQRVLVQPHITYIMGYLIKCRSKKTLAYSNGTEDEMHRPYNAGREV